MSPDHRTVIETAALRALICRADSYLSLVLHRHLAVHTPCDLRRDIDVVVGELRDLYDKLGRLPAEAAPRVEPPETGCINCGEVNEGGYETEEVGSFCQSCWELLGEYFARVEPPPEPTDQPSDRQGRFMLNAYGRRCWDLGYEAAKSGAAPVPAAGEEPPR